MDLLEQNWSRLEKNNKVPFFLSWHWISCWIKTYRPNLISVCAKYNSQIVAIGLFTESLAVRHHFIHSRQLRLHQMGNILMDQIWMEYNDFICDEEHCESAINACLKALKQIELEWDEVILSMMSRFRAKVISNNISNVELEPCQPCFSVNLSLLRHKNMDYLELLNSNTRYQIRRSIRLYEENIGPLQLQKAQTVEQALSYFHHAGTFHMQRWADSGYKNKQFVQFHENLIQDCFKEKNIIFLKLLAGDQTIAVMYYHIVDTTVYFYLHGLNYDKNKKLKPGLVAHTFATNYFIQQGMDEYDYMGGYSQYKEQLAQQAYEQTTVIIRQPRPQFTVENLARKVKNKIISLSK